MTHPKHPVEIHLPKETVSDDAYRVVEVKKLSGSKVEEGETFAIFETSKAALELHATAAGFLHHKLLVNATVPIGALVATISETNVEPHNLRISAPSQEAASQSTKSSGGFSKAAEELIQKHQLDRKFFEDLAFVRKEDVENFLGKDQQDKITGSTTRVLIIGGGGHAKMCIDILRQTHQFEIAGILDSKLELGTNVLGVPVLGRPGEMKRFHDQGIAFAVNGVGGATQHPIREKIFAELKAAGFFMPNLIHPKATMEPSAVMGEGNQLMAGSIVGSAAVIANNCIVNCNAVVSHDCKLDSNVHVAPGAALGGTVKVGSNTLIGMGSTVFLGVRIGKEVVIANGAHVEKDIESGSTVRR